MKGLFSFLLRSRLLLGVMLLAAFLSFGRTARAQTQENAGLWVMLMMEGPLGGEGQEPSRLRWWLDVQPRYLEKVSGLKQGLLRPGIGYALEKHTTVWLGYARIYTSSETGPSSNEDRIWQQLLWKPRIGAIGFQSRTRLEQRFLDTGSATGWRFRQFVKTSWNIGGASRFSLEAYDEVFMNMNRTDWGQRTGFAQNRLFLGVGMKLGDRGRTKIEVGYLNQYLDRVNRDVENHILSLNLFLNF